MYELGQLGVVTLGQHFSRCDGNSGSVGDKGAGTPQAGGFDTCTQETPANN